MRKKTDGVSDLREGSFGGKVWVKKRQKQGYTCQFKAKSDKYNQK